MPTEEKMNIDERYKYLRVMKKRYIKANRKTKGDLLEEMEAVTGLHHKSLIQLMNSPLRRKTRRKERKTTYKADVTQALWVIYESLDYICAERLTPNLVWMAHHLDHHGELRATPELLEQLGQISQKGEGRNVSLAVVSLFPLSLFVLRTLYKQMSR